MNENPAAPIKDMPATEPPTPTIPAPVVKTSANSEPVSKKSGGGTCLIAGGVGLLMFALGVAVGIGVLFFALSQTSIDGGFPDPTITPTITETKKSIDRNKSILYVLDNEVYKVDIATGEKTKLNLPKVESGGAGVKEGQFDPILNDYGNMLAFINYVDYLAEEDTNTVSVYNFETEKIQSTTVPVANNLYSDIFIAGFSKDNSRLLVTQTCNEIVEGLIDDMPPSAPCDPALEDHYVSLFTFDISNAMLTPIKLETPVNDATASLGSYDDLLGWAPYATDKILVVTHEYRDGAIYASKMYEIDINTGGSRLIKRLSAERPDGQKYKWLDILDVDSNRNILFRAGDGDSWDLYYVTKDNFAQLELMIGAKKIKTVTGSTNMQWPQFLASDPSKITYWSSAAHTMTVIDTTGKLVLEQYFPTGASLYGSQYAYRQNETKGFNLLELTTVRELLSVEGLAQEDGYFAPAEIIR